MTEIKITVDAGLPERSGRINRQTYLAIKKAKGDTAFFPDGKFIPVGQNPFDPDYIILVADEEMDEGTLVVSRDVKALFYKDLEILSF